MAKNPGSGTRLSRTLHENGIIILIDRSLKICALPLDGNEQDVPGVLQALLSFLHLTNIVRAKLSTPIVDHLVDDRDITAAKNPCQILEN
ncbi:hypothetical protein [Candidatus Nitrospira salsa]|nr:MAG: hypothetical protein NPIRA04_02160 [Nitrospirales bacterium]